MGNTKTLPIEATGRVKELGHRVRVARTRRGLSIAEVAAKHSAHNRAERSSGAFAVVAPRHHAAKRLLELTQAGTIFPTFTTRQEAIHWCRLARAAAPSDDAAPLAPK